MLIPFLKMHAQGNDFVILDYFASPLPELDFPSLSRYVCKTHTGIGADGLVLLKPCEDADARMVIYNADGSLAQMCGSALRCVSFHLAGKLGKNELVLQTESGLKHAMVTGEEVSVVIGRPEFCKDQHEVMGFVGSMVDVGNVHFVVWQDDLHGQPHITHGSVIEQHDSFPHAVNVHFVKLINEHEIQMLIWERGSGATLACGTGATASVYSGIMQGKLLSPVKVNMPGGSVEVTASDGTYYLKGGVNKVFSGEFTWKA